MGSTGHRTAVSQTETDPARPTIFATQYPLAYFAERVGGSQVRVALPGGLPSGPSWTPSIADIQTMQVSDLVLVGDLSQEQWLSRTSLPAGRVVSTTVDITDRLIPAEGTTTHSHGPDGSHSHVANASNPWLDLELAAAQAKAVKNAIERLGVVDATMLESSLQGLTDDLLNLDRQLRVLSPRAADVPLLAATTDFRYLVRRYGLRLKALDTDIVGRAEVIPQLEQLWEAYPARWIIWAEQPTDEEAARLRELGVESAVIDPCTTPPANGDYVSVMQQNVDTLVRILGRQ